MPPVMIYPQFLSVSPMDEIDRLLAKLEPQSQSQSNQTSPSQSAKDSMNSQADQPAPPQATASIDSLLQSIDTKAPSPNTHLQQSQTKPQTKPHTKPQIKPSSEENLLEQIQQQYQQQDQAELQRQQELQRQAEQKQQQESQQKQQRLEQLRIQRRAELEKTASDWLKQLNPKSAEGRWFEEFACSYASRLEAAIDYLEALEEVNPQP